MDTIFRYLFGANGNQVADFENQLVNIHVNPNRYARMNLSLQAVGTVLAGLGLPITFWFALNSIIGKNHHAILVWSGTLALLFLMGVFCSLAVWSLRRWNWI